MVVVLARAKNILSYREDPLLLINPAPQQHIYPCTYLPVLICFHDLPSFQTVPATWRPITWKPIAPPSGRVKRVSLVGTTWILYCASICLGSTNPYHNNRSDLSSPSIHRRKKSRCPGEKPVCGHCRRLRQRCVYGDAEPPSNRHRLVSSHHHSTRQYPMADVESGVPDRRHSVQVGQPPGLFSPGVCEREVLLAARTLPLTATGLVAHM